MRNRAGETDLTIPGIQPRRVHIGEFDVDSFVEALKSLPDQPRSCLYPIRLANKAVQRAFGKYFLFRSVADFQPEEVDHGEAIL